MTLPGRSRSVLKSGGYFLLIPKERAGSKFPISLNYGIKP